MENKNERIENKITLGDFNCTTDEIDRDGRNKKDSIDVVPIMPCQHSSWIMGLRIYGAGRTQNPLSPPAVIGSLERIQDKHSLY